MAGKANKKTPARARGEEQKDFKGKIAETYKKIDELQKEGYTCIGPMVLSSDDDANSRRTELFNDAASNIGGKYIAPTLGMFDGKQSMPIRVAKVGTPGYGYIPWGPNNLLPNLIFNLASNLPYTAAALKYITDLTVGLGPALMYKWPHYAGGTIKEELIPFEHAGVLISNRIREIRNQIAARDAQQENAQKQEGGEVTPATGGDTIMWSDALNPPPAREETRPEDEPGTLEFELERLREDYTTWKNSWEEISVFIEENNLGLHYQECMMDDTRMDIYFPAFGLSVGRSKEEWNPKITQIKHLPAVCTRMEQMDDSLRINYVYYSERWRKDATSELEAKDIVAYPAVSPKSMLNDLRKMVYRHRNSSIKKRPLWMACPIRYPSMQKPYYPQPDWWSIFPSLVYDYACTLMADKAIARQNSTMWSKIIFINTTYLESLYADRGADSPEKQEEIRKQIHSRVNKILERKENNGKSLLMDMTPGPDGKNMQYSIQIVDIPQPTSGADTKDELEEISSIIFFAIGVHPALIGATPGKSGSSGGTFQRELQLLKQSQVSPRQRAYLKFLQTIYAFNKWDKHGVWVVRQQVLTTLDRNSNGLEETVSD